LASTVACIDISLTDVAKNGALQIHDIDFTQAANQIEKEESVHDRSDSPKIVVVATGKRIGIYGTSSSVNASTLP
jgi:hypothetical protein